MEVELSGDSKILLKPGLRTEIGRDSGITTNDRTVSRRHVSFELLLTSDEPKVRFEVTGRNPIWVQALKSGKVNTFRSCQSGGMEAGDKFCVSAKNPVWFTVKRIDVGGKRERNGVKEVDLEDSLERRCELIDGNDLEPEFVDVSDIDPVKEFGFLVMGHEFDKYPKKMIKDTKDWDWFIEEPGEASEDEEFQKKKKHGRKRKKGDENDDEEWTGESEEEKEQITSTKKVSRPKYSTRSKDRGKPRKNAHLIPKRMVTDQKTTDDKEEEVDDEDDETLGGFIVDDELENEEDIDNNEDEEEEEEEEFEEDNDEDE